MTVRRSLVAAAAAVLLPLALPPSVAWADWSATSDPGTAAGRAATMPRGLPPSAAVSGSDVTLRWPAALLPNGSAVAGYVITRIDGNGRPAAVAADCAGTITATTCVEHGVPAGTWAYADTPVQFGWTGASSPTATVVVGG